ncbi:MAG: DUF3990 domain-containing protein [Lachnospiraceae bacterium]|nr:DUF3990 domain-containing protein [Lachnospiraceae bacterium]
MKEIVYHGSEKIIEKPEYGLGSLHNDYGRGFYCTREVELAKEWACSKGNDGYANSYELDYSGLLVINLNSDDYSILNWLALLAENRTYWQQGSISKEAKDYIKQNFLIDTSGYDVIIGYRADDSYFSFAQDFVSGTISLGKLSEAMRLGRLGEQIVLKSKKAFECIKYSGNELALAEEYSIKKANRDALARRAYRQTKAASADINDIYILDIMREGIKNGDPRLR